MKLYYAVILDHKQEIVDTLPLTKSNKHAAFLAQQYVENCPPAAGFKIRVYYPDAGYVCMLLNNEDAQHKLINKKIQLINAIKDLLK
jgi:hypothetical protein